MAALESRFTNSICVCYFWLISPNQRFFGLVSSVPFTALSALCVFLSPERSAGFSQFRLSGVYVLAYPLDALFLGMIALVYALGLGPYWRTKDLRKKDDMCLSVIVY